MKTMASSSSSKKKAKKNNSSISQFFRDRMQSHRQRTGAGSPLVVETGFPASLVDLIVKNRQRLRRSSECSLIQESSASPATVVEEEEEEEDDAVRDTAPDVERCKGFLPAVLIMCVVSVLAFGAKKFALGLTMSAFFLIFMESMGKNVFGLLIPCYDSKQQFSLMVAKFLRFIGIGEAAKIGSNGSDFRDNSEIEMMNSEDFLAVASIGDVECKEIGVDRNSKIRKSNSLSAFLEEEEEVFEFKKKKKWQKAKMKSKLKHIFARKEKKKMMMKKEEANVETSERRSECQSNSSVVSCEGKEAVAVSCPEVEQKKKCNNSGCLIVCTIVLIGLSGGRMYALLLILSCCLLKKSGCGVFMIRHFFPDV